MYDISIKLTHNNGQLVFRNVVDIKERQAGLSFTTTTSSELSTNTSIKPIHKINKPKRIFIPWHMIYMYALENYRPNGFAPKTLYESDEKGKGETLSDTLNELDNRLKEIRGEVKEGLNSLYGSGPKTIFGQTFDEMLKGDTQNDPNN